jgi:hypothetical protein
MVMATATTIKQQSTKCGSKRNGGGGDDVNDVNGHSEGDSGRRRGRRRRHGNRGDGDGHGGDGCRFLGVANLIEVRNANCQINNVFRSEYYLCE